MVIFGLVIRKREVAGVLQQILSHTFKLHIVKFGTTSRNRTHNFGFGVRHFTIKLQWQKLIRILLFSEREIL